MTYLSYLLNEENVNVDRKILTIDEMKEALCRLLSKI